VAVFATLLTYLGHVLAIAADGFAALLAGLARFLRGELVSVAALVRGAAAFAGDFALLGLVHARKTASVTVTFITSARHDRSPVGG
jgi:hypothetical protein